MTHRGRLSRADVGRILGLSARNIQYWELRGRLPQPQIDPVNGRAVYTVTEVETVARILGITPEYVAQVKRERAENAALLAAARA